MDKLFTDNDLERAAAEFNPTKQRHGYLGPYWRHFRDHQHSAAKVLEIGVETGSSLRTWKRFFPNAVIWGIDINTACKAHEEDRISVFIGDSSDPTVVEKFIAEAGSDFDIIIDDGDHYYRSQIETFRLLFPHLKMGGVYAAEDLAVTDGPHRMFAVDAFKEFVEGVNYWPAGNKNVSLPEFPTDNIYINNITGVSFYRYLCIIDKSPAPIHRNFPVAPPEPGAGIYARSPIGRLLRRIPEYFRDKHRRWYIPARTTRPNGMFRSFTDRLAKR